MIRDVCAGIAALLEPSSQAEIDETSSPPFSWEPGRLYVYPTSQRFTPIESGPTVRQDFDLLAVYVEEGEGEEALRRRSAELSDALDQKADGYTRAVRTNQRTALWDNIQAALDARPPATLQTRAIALRISGYRIVS